MNETAHDRFPRLAPILLIAALIGLAILRPGNLAGDSAIPYRLATTLSAIVALCYIAWRFHGILAAAAAAIVFRLADAENPVSAAFVERQADAFFLATLAIGIAAGSRQGRAGKLPWLLIGFAAVAVALFGWYGLLMPGAEDSIARCRLQQVTIAIAVLSAALGLFTRWASWLNRLKLLLATIGMPAAGVVAFRLVNGEWPRLLSGGDWPNVFLEWRQACSNDKWSAGAWCWSWPTVAVPLALLGLWRTVARGRKQFNEGHPPLAWLLSVASLGAIVTLGARPLAAGSLALAAAGALLSVFGIADLFQALVERIELRPPPPDKIQTVK